MSGQKTSKNWVFGVFSSVIKHFAILLYDFLDAHTCKIFAHSVVQNVATIKKEVLEEKICVSEQKDIKKLGFRSLQVCTRTLRNLTV